MGVYYDAAEFSDCRAPEGRQDQLRAQARPLHERRGLARNAQDSGSQLDLQQFPELDVNGFLSHTLLHLIGEVGRQVFVCKSSTLGRKNPFDLHPELRNDSVFKDFLELHREVTERTHSHGGATPSELRSDEFERFILDLIEITTHKGYKYLLLFYDEANRLALDLSVGFLTWNVEALNRAGIVTVYAASPEMAEKFNPWSDREIHIGPFVKIDDMLTLLSRYYFGDTSQKDNLPLSRDAIIRIWEFTWGIPYLIQHLSGQSFSRANREGFALVEERHVRSAHEELTQRKPELFHE